MDFEDKVIICGDCGKEFTHTAEDQRRYAERGFTEAPKRCRECRQARKDKAATSKSRPERRREGGPPRGGGRGFQDRPRSQGFQGSRGGGYGRPPRQSFEATCAACGASTTVPFEPTPGRQVYCRACYQKLKQE